MISSGKAQEIVLSRLEQREDDGTVERFAIQSCTLSPRGDYWLIRSNSEDYVIRGMLERCYVGVNAYLVDTVSGAMELVGSAQSVEEFLQDKYDLREANGMHYLLTPAFGRQDKQAVINLRKKLECSLEKTIAMLSENHRRWFTGKRRVLIAVQDLLASQNIAMTLTLAEHIQEAISIDEAAWHIDHIKQILRLKVCLIGAHVPSKAFTLA